MVGHGNIFCQSLKSNRLLYARQVFWLQLQHDLSVCDIETIGGPGKVVAEFFRLSFGGIVLGLLMGVLLQFCLSRCFNDFQTEVTLTLMTAFGTMLLAEGTALGFSGILSLVTVGLTMSAKGKFFLSSEATHAMHHVWGTLGHLANTIIFFLAGLIIAGPDVLGSQDFTETFGERFSKLLLLFVMLHVIRAIMMVSLWPIISRGHYEFNWRHATAITYGGLRGAVGLTLGLIVHETLLWHVDAAARQLGNEILFYASGVAVLTLVINGSTMEMVLKWLEISGSSKSSQRAYENVSLKLAEEVTLLFDKLKESETKNSSGVDWAAALSYVPSRSKAAYQCLNLAIREEIELTADSSNLVTPSAQGDINEGNSSSDETLSGTFSMNPMRALTSSLPSQRTEQPKFSLKSVTSKVVNTFGEKKHHSDFVNELLQRVPNSLKGRILRNEKKWPSVLSAESGFQTSVIMAQSEISRHEQKVGLRYSFPFRCLHSYGNYSIHPHVIRSLSIIRRIWWRFVDAL